MPPRARVLKPKKERDCNALDQLGIATGEYVYLVTKHTEGARHLPNLTEIHEQGSQQWLRIAPVMPAPGDPDYAAKRQVFFDTCDRYCKCDTPADPVESVIAVQAAGFAMQTSMAEMDALPGADKSYVYKKAKEYSFEKCRKREAELGIPYRPIPPQAIVASNASFPMIPYPPRHRGSVPHRGGRHGVLHDRRLRHEPRARRVVPHQSPRQRGGGAPHEGADV